MLRKLSRDRRSILRGGLAFLGLGATIIHPSLSSAMEISPMTTSPSTTGRTNRDVVEAYFIALETGRFEVLREIFAEDAKQIMPYSFGNFPRSFDGREGIYRQYSSLPEIFSKMSFPRTIYPTENPDVLFVQFKGDIEIKAGGRYQNDYVGIFRFENGLIKEYTEYFNPILVSEAFNVPI
ncbi:nuclear transport factor 2 family protein [Leptolyngbya ohadii]|uniref:nuclear transport factor 2 family protein n=1 Tax=Leptolyngbya ohadii TaxID=1962290 RepID=UPI0015C68CEE|nr:nuclear transport factor 2 family protein [Leptolyngbya ohadii]